MMVRRLPPPQQLRISRCGDTSQSALVFTHTASKVHTFNTPIRSTPEETMVNKNISVFWLIVQEPGLKSSLILT